MKTTLVLTCILICASSCFAAQSVKEPHNQKKYVGTYKPYKRPKKKGALNKKSAPRRPSHHKYQPKKMGVGLKSRNSAFSKRVASLEQEALELLEEYQLRGRQVRDLIMQSEELTGSIEQLNTQIAALTDRNTELVQS